MMWSLCHGLVQCHCEYARKRKPKAEEGRRQAEREREKEAERKGRNKKTNKEKLTLIEKVNRAAIACSTGIAIFPTFPFLSFPFMFCSALSFLLYLSIKMMLLGLTFLSLHCCCCTHREREREIESYASVMSKLCPGSSLKIGKTGSRPKQN